MRRTRSLCRYLLQPKQVLLMVLLSSATTYLLTIFYQSYYGDIPRKELRFSLPPFGQYRKLADRLIEFTNQGHTTVPYRILLQELHSNGSKDTVRHLSAGAADCGVIQANTREHARNVHSVAYLFSEAIMLIGRRELNSAYELKAAAKHQPYRVATLHQGSQTAEDLTRLLGFYGFKTQRDYIVIPGDYSEGLQRLHRGEVDYAFFISGLGNEDVQASLEGTRSLHLVPLLNMDAFAMRNPGYRIGSIPQGFFGREFSEYRTLLTKATLVCSGDVPEEVIFHLARDLFERRAHMQVLFELLELEPVAASPDMFFPPHPGALKYFDRQKPTFLERHPATVQVIIFFLTAIAYVAGALLKFRFWRSGPGPHRRK